MSFVLKDLDQRRARSRFQCKAGITERAEVSDGPSGRGLGYVDFLVSQHRPRGDLGNQLRLDRSATCAQDPSWLSLLGPQCWRQRVQWAFSGEKFIGMPGGEREPEATILEKEPAPIRAVR